MSADKTRYRIIHTFGNLFILEKHDSWFNAFKPSGKFFWSYKGVTTGPFKSTYEALEDYRSYRDFMRNNPTTNVPNKNDEKSTQIAVKEMPKPKIVPENVIFVDFSKKMRIVTKL